MIKVGVVGYGTIGKRVADAVNMQDDMELIGVTARSFNYRIMTAVEKSIPLYSTTETIEDAEELLITELVKSGVKLVGAFKDLLEKCDVIVDCTPKKSGAKNKELYSKYPVKVLYQGGEKDHIADTSFVAQVNYDKARDKKNIRIVSCNTTGLSRVLYALDKKLGVESCRATLIRRAADASDTDTGPINAIVPTLEMPSHHGPDVNSILPNIAIFTNAVIVPTTLMHLHVVTVYLKSPSNKEEIISILKNETRIRVIKAKVQLDSTAALMEYAKDSQLWNRDMMELCVWEESLYVNKNEVSFFQAVHQESIVVPENVDAIRAVMNKCSREESIAKTNKSLGLK